MLQVVEAVPMLVLVPVRPVQWQSQRCNARAQVFGMNNLELET